MEERVDGDGAAVSRTRWAIHVAIAMGTALLFWIAFRDPFLATLQVSLGAFLPFNRDLRTRKLGESLGLAWWMELSAAAITLLIRGLTGRM